VKLCPLLLRLEALDGHLLLASIARPPDGSEKKKKSFIFQTNMLKVRLFSFTQVGKIEFFVR
jgi:hypothetical protein